MHQIRYDFKHYFSVFLLLLSLHRWFFPLGWIHSPIVLRLLLRWSGRSRFLLLLLLACCLLFLFVSHSSTFVKVFPVVRRRDARFRVLSQLHLLFFCTTHVRGYCPKDGEEMVLAEGGEANSVQCLSFSSFQVSSSTIYFSYCTQFLLACTVATNNWFELSLIRVKWL